MSGIKKISIIGVGFMGASLSLAVKERFPSVAIWGYARSRRSFNNLQKLKVVDNISRKLEQVVDGSDLIIVATPVLSVMDYFKRITPFLKKGSIVIDLGSTKSFIEKAARKYLPKNIYFVGVHPLCGGHTKGPGMANKDLYKKSICVITSKKNKTTKIVEGFWKKLGAKTVYLTSSMHDLVLSYVSHLPHIASFSLTQVTSKEYTRVAPASFGELTRFSASPPQVWAEIFLSNKKNLLKSIKEYVRFIKVFENYIKNDDKDALLDLITKINKKHQSFKI